MLLHVLNTIHQHNESPEDLSVETLISYGRTPNVIYFKIFGSNFHINKDEIIDFVNLTKDKNLDIRFIELMPIGAAKNYKGTSNEEINQIINKKEISKEPLYKYRYRISTTKVVLKE